MNVMTPVDEMDGFSFHETILQQGELISDKLNMLRIEHIPLTPRRACVPSRWRRLPIS
jgi:hypothetical protein